MRALLLYNPQAGRNRQRRASQVQAAASALNEQGFEADTEATLGKGTGGEQARQAVHRGYKAIFACGGDGTVHDVLQGVVGTGAALGILPFGSANALARELGISANPLRAVRLFRPRHHRSLRIGEVSTAEYPRRYFLSMAGAGPDGHLMYRMLTVDRSLFGRWLYYFYALRLLLRGPWHPMQVRSSNGDDFLQSDDVVAAMALRVGSLGGLFSGIARGASLEGNSMRVLLVRSPALINLPLWFLASWTRLGRFHPGLRIAQAQQLVLQSSTRIHVQADGEWVGSLPARIQLSGETINLFVPTQKGNV